MEPDADDAASTEPIARARQAFLGALRRGDARAAATAYAEDARVMLPAAAMMDGRDSIEGFWRAGLEAGMEGIELRPVDVVRDSALICEVGRYELHLRPTREAASEERGRYVVIHRRDPDGTWKRAVELFEPDPEWRT
jgi:uncharacterized protein (TIGR02246 family)